MAQDQHCSICGDSVGVLSDEHIPPKSTGNRGRHRVEVLRFSESESPGGSTARPQLIDLPDGVALKVLCASCNSKLGSRLGTGFADFAQQVSASGRFASPGGGLFASAVNIYPARVIRHLLLNFLCVQQDALDARWDSLRDFIRSRGGSLPPSSPRVGLYYNRSGTYRLFPVGAVNSLRARAGEPWHGAEITAPGLGAVYTLGDPSTVEPVVLPRLLDVSTWGDAPFGERVTMALDLPAYWVESVHPLGFGKGREVARWQEKNLIVWLATRMELDDVTDVSGLLWRPTPRVRTSGR